MSLKVSVILFSAFNLMTAIALSLAGILGIRQLLSYGECREVCSLAGIAFSVDGLSEERILVIILVLSQVHWFGALSAIKMSYSGVMGFVTAYALRFLILYYDTTLKVLVAPQDWKHLVLMRDNRQTKIENDIRLCVTIIQLCLFFLGVELMVSLRKRAYNRIRCQILDMNRVESLGRHSNKKSFM